jgi:metal-responsive CopG/Arc/MetJ family transcriptional regulator
VESTTFHIPDELLREIDRAARKMGVSRNRFVLQACGEALARRAGEWPAGFFDSAYSDEDKNLLEQATRELEKEVLARRMNRGAVAL